MMTNQAKAPHHFPNVVTAGGQELKKSSKQFGRLIVFIIAQLFPRDQRIERSLFGRLLTMRPVVEMSQILSTLAFQAARFRFRFYNVLGRGRHLA